jgi:hypothetical protein
MISRFHRLSISPLGVAAIFLTGCLAGSAVQALSGGPAPVSPEMAFNAAPPSVGTPFPNEPPQPPARRAAKTFAVRGGGTPAPSD